MTLPPKNVSLAACLNSRKENGNDEDGTSVGDARIYAKSAATGTACSAQAVMHYAVSVVHWEMDPRKASH